MRRLVALVLLATACSPPPSPEVFVEITNGDVAIPATIDGLSVEITGENKRPTFVQTPTLALCAMGGPNGCVQLPVSMTLIPGMLAPATPVRVVVGASQGRDLLFDEAVVFTFDESRRVLTIPLYGACAGQHCADANQACGRDGVCGSIRPQPHALVEELPSGDGDQGP